MIKRIAVAALLFAAFALPLHADFAAVARAIDNQNGVDRVWIPFLGIARAVVRVVQPEGVHDFQLVTFTNERDVDPKKLQDILQEKAGPGYRPLVQVRSKRSGDWSFIYAKPSRNANRMELLVLTHDGEETVLVRVDVNAAVLARELGERPREVTRMARH
ncbi:MAG TPA: hypothetical protein VGQ76_01510 [Thermoanaerobaculia bacterium]|jgi:hypothetical protein|nr:hypothetical protein [Thermoanaerobaculia bacterium]